MKKSRFIDSQIMAILKLAEAGAPVSKRCREPGMSSASFYKWRDGCIFDGAPQRTGR